MELQIFNKRLFNNDIDLFFTLSQCDQKKWIKKHTNQQNDALIIEFLKSPNIKNSKECLNCGKDANISKVNAIEVTVDSEPTMVAKPSTNNNPKRQPRVKKRENQ